MPSSRALDQGEFERFPPDGYVLRKRLFERDEVALMNDVIRQGPTIHDATYARKDASGTSTELALWFTLSDDIFGAAARSESVVNSIEAVLGGPAAFYHSKLMLKRPRVGGAWEWHQNYGYWYRHDFATTCDSATQTWEGRAAADCAGSGVEDTAGARQVHRQVRDERHGRVQAVGRMRH